MALTETSRAGESLANCIDDLNRISDRLDQLYDHLPIEDYICTLQLYEAFLKHVVELQRRTASQAPKQARVAIVRH